MKKNIIFLLILSVFLSLCACSSQKQDPVDNSQKQEEPAVSPNQAAFEAAQALLDAGDYEAAIEAFSSIGLYSQIADKIEEARTKLAEQARGFLYGTWKDLNSDLDNVYALTFTQDDVVTNSGGSTGTYTMEDGQVVVQLSTRSTLTAEEISGVTHLVNDFYDLVPETDYASLCPVKVEITLDNWEEYFEIRPVVEETKNAFGEIIWIDLGHGIFLRDEYLERLIPATRFLEQDVAFKLSCVSEEYQITGDIASGNYTISDTPAETRDHEPVVAELWDHRFSDSGAWWDGCVVADVFFGGKSVDVYGKETWMTLGDLEMIDVRGTLTLARE